MPALTRRRSDDSHREVWLVYFGDVRVGSIGERAGAPVDVDQWQWRCGIHPGCSPSEHRDGTAPDFFTARREFETAWREFSAEKTEADYQEWRDQRDRTARKYASWARGEKRELHPAPLCVASAASPSIATSPLRVTITVGTFTPRKPNGDIDA